LVTPHISQDSRTGTPEYDKFTGEPKVAYYHISLLGKLLLRTIGIKDDEFEQGTEVNKPLHRTLAPLGLRQHQ
jgi:hypothetical protein